VRARQKERRGAGEGASLAPLTPRCWRGVPDAFGSEVRGRERTAAEWWQFEGQVCEGRAEARGVEEEAALRLLRLLLYEPRGCNSARDEGVRGRGSVRARGEGGREGALSEELRKTLHGICRIAERKRF